MNTGKVAYACKVMNTCKGVYACNCSVIFLLTRMKDLSL